MDVLDRPVIESHRKSIAVSTWGAKTNYWHAGGSPARIVA